MKFKVGDIVRIKSLEEIEKTSYRNEKDSKGGDVYRCSFINKNGKEIRDSFFISSMAKYCGKVFTVKGYNTKGDEYIFEGAGWSWLENWLESVLDEKAEYCNTLEEAEEKYCDSLEEAEQQILKDKETNKKIKDIFEKLVSMDTQYCIDCDCDGCNIEGPCIIVSLNHLKDDMRSLLKEM